MRAFTPIANDRSPFLPSGYDDAADVAECALDEQLEMLHRQYAAASRAASRARFELELLEKRSDINAHILDQARRQKGAAETRSLQLLKVIDALEDRLDNRALAEEGP